MLNELNGCSNFVELWEQTANSNPDKPAFIYRDLEFTYYEVESMVNALAKSFVEDFGIAAGDRIAIVLSNRIEFIVSFLAAQKAKAIPVPLNTRLKAQQFDELFRLVKPVAIVTSNKLKKNVEPLIMSHAYIHHRFGVQTNEPDWNNFDEIITANQFEDFEGEPITNDEIAAVLFTSGTAGKQKGAVIRHGDMLNNISMTQQVFDFAEEDVHMLTVPLFHCTGLESIFPTSVYNSSTCVLDDQITPGYLEDLVQNTGATTFITVPTTLNLLTSYSELTVSKFSSLRLIAFSGSPISESTLSRLSSLFPFCELVNFYGLTETTSILTRCRSEELADRPDSIGRPLEGVRMRVATNGEEAEAGVEGELEIGREHIVSSYLHLSGKLEERFRGDWFRTGDLAVVDEDGYIFLKGRSTDLIIVGGENVYASEVESVLSAHPDVRDCAVVGEPNKIFGEAVKAFVVPKSLESVKTLDIKKFCFQRLPSYKVPLVIEVLKEIPRSPSGKVLKGQLK
ncbi:MAG: class I adenylate-forming enzyme family protein [Planctomycetota bacterium]|nr:class I adenylate-forming enzyme family protein [Planctomycetota bacterium]